MEAAVWTIAICTIVIASILLIFVIAGIGTLIFIRRVIEAVARVGGAIGKKVCSCAACRGITHEKVVEAKHEVEEQVQSKANVAVDIVEWAVVGLSLWQKIKEKRR